MSRGEPPCPLCGGPWSQCACNFSQNDSQSDSQNEKESKNEEPEGVEDEDVKKINRFVKIIAAVFVIAVIIFFCIDYFRQS